MKVSPPALLAVALSACSSSGLRFESHAFGPLPTLGKSAKGADVKLGGFSGLACRNFDAASGEWVLVTLTDRGPNLDPNGKGRPFLLPNFTPRIVEFGWNPATNALRVRSQLPLTIGKKKMTGLPNLARDEMPLDHAGNLLRLDPNGIDPEGVALGENGSYWVVEEYRPSVMNFDSYGALIKRSVPRVDANKSTGALELPAELAKRRDNRGLEGVAVINGRLYAFLQSPFEKNGRSTPVLEMDTATRQSLGLKSYDFHLNDGDLKIGDATPLADGSLLVLEQDGKKQRAIYRWWPDGGKSELVVELAKHADFIKPEKMEGLAMVDETTLVLVNDDDFGLASDQGVPPHLYVVRLPKALPVAPCRR